VSVGGERRVNTSFDPVRSSTNKRRSDGKISAGCVVRRSLLVFFTTLLLIVGIVFAVVFVIAHGPSETARNKAVMSAMQASATKWVPGLFLSDETVNSIIENSKVVVTDVKPITDIGGGSEDDGGNAPEDRWEKAIDGMLLEFINGKTFKGYVLLIKDPSRISVAIKDKSFASASRVFEIVEQYNAIAAINGGEFPDNGVTTLSNPIGLTYSQGECVWDDGLPRTFIGFTNDNKLFVEEGTSRSRADEVGIRDAVAFQTGNTLITNDGKEVTYYYADSNTGVAQRTAIGQLADGTVMFLVTDGRTAQSLGATKNDIIDTFVKYGAVTAGLLDGGSSALLWYRDWYTKYNVDQSELDDWQKMGLVNIYKAFTNPRAIPTYFVVK
jgi:exopolysaccharide biosynthesis protein